MKNCSSTFKILNEDVDLKHVSIAIHVVYKNVIKASGLRDFRLNQIVDRIMHILSLDLVVHRRCLYLQMKTSLLISIAKKLQNVNPTDIEDPKDTKNNVVTARDRLEDDNQG